MKKSLSIFLVTAILAALISGCSPAKSGALSSNMDDGGKSGLSIITTLFPIYDFARHIAGDKAEVTMLLPPGVESHSFEPTPADIISINKCDLFIYTGANMEAWAATVLKGVTNENVAVLEVSKGIPLEKEEHEGENREAESSGGELHEYDPHIWTSPVIAKKMVDNILASIIEIDPDNADYYTKNADEYKAGLDGLDKQFREIVDNAKRKDIYVGDRFAMRYFAEEYGLTYHAAFDSCSAETEPSAAVIADMIDQIKAKRIPVVYYAELTDPKIARSLSQETGAEMLLLHSAHNVTKEEFESGITYMDIMKRNAENLKKGLN